MIKVNKYFKLEKITDGKTDCWVIHERKDSSGKEIKVGKFKGQKAKVSYRKKYFPSLEQAAQSIIDSSPLGCQSMEELLNVIEETKQDIIKAIKKNGGNEK